METPKDYLDLAKQHQKRGKWEERKIPTSKEEFYSYVSNEDMLTKKMTEKQVDKLFWNVLVHLGWKINMSWSNKRKIVLPCPKCNLIIDELDYDGLLVKDAKSMSKQKNVNGMLDTHNGEPCIPEAIPEGEEA